MIIELFSIQRLSGKKLYLVNLLILNDRVAFGFGTYLKRYCEKAKSIFCLDIGRMSEYRNEFAVEIEFFGFRYIKHWSHKAILN